MEEQLFCLKPGRALADFIRKCKIETHRIAGEQKYLSDPPHLTLYVGNFDYKSLRLLDKLDNSLNFHTIEIGLSGWTTFHDDPITGGHTLTIAVNENDLLILRQLQVRLAGIACEYRKDEILSRYRNTIQYTKEMLKSLKKYGFPFIGDNWRAHFTVASINKMQYESVWDAIKNRKAPLSVRINTLAFYRIRADGFEMIREWRGAQHNS